MIADLDKTIQQLLVAELAIKNDEIEIAFEQPTREWSSQINKPTVNFFLYDVRENPHLRTHQWETLTNGRKGLPPGDNLAHLKRTALRVDCFYMITTWAPKHARRAEDEHRLLTRTLLALFQYPILPEERLETRLRNPDFAIRTRLASHDVLTNPAEVWGALDNEMKPSVSYIVTLSLDPWAVVSSPAVTTVTLATGQEAQPELLYDHKLAEDKVSARMNVIGGTVRSSSANGVSLAGIEIAIRETGLYTKTDAQGRFRFSGLLPAEYTLIARTTSGVLAEKAIRVPAPANANYDLEIQLASATTDATTNPKGKRS